MQALKQWIKKQFGWWIYRRQLSAVRKKEIDQWTEQWKEKPPARLSDTSFDVFTYHGEDGIIQYLLNLLPGIPRIFADIGAGDCIKSNCACLAIHDQWTGVFIDKDEKQLEVGRSFYKGIRNKGAGLQFIAAEVKPGMVNALLKQAGMGGPIGLLSIDIDGNDCWIWQAIEIIQPAIVLVEAKVEFGLRNIAVPFGPANHHSADEKYNGASVQAFCKLAASKGYKLAGANKQGYNLFFVKQDSPLPGETAEDVLRDPEIQRSFYNDHFFNTHSFEII